MAGPLYYEKPNSWCSSPDYARSILDHISRQILFDGKPTINLTYTEVRVYRDGTTVVS
jgi:hypothetical protein